MSNVIEDVLHTIIDVVSGRQAHLSADAAAALHDALTPGYDSPPLSDAEQAQLDALEKRKAAAEASAAANAPAPEPGTSVADADQASPAAF